MPKKIKTIICGASGYVGEELLRYVLPHPEIELVAITSRKFSGKKICEVFPRFKKIGNCCLKFSAINLESLEEVNRYSPQVIFLALPHGVSAELLPKFHKNSQAKLIDLSADFRLNSSSIYREFYKSSHPAPQLFQDAVYGLPEIHGEEILQKKIIACPGCYPTSILLPLIPLVKANIIATDDIVINSLSGTSGAGKSPNPDLSFSEHFANVRAYGTPKHRHLAEIEEQLNLFAPKNSPKINVSFAPHLLPIKRGILTTISAKLQNHENFNEINNEKVGEIYAKIYRKQKYIRLLGSDKFPEIKNVANSNFIDIGWQIDHRTKRIFILSAIDNLGKGAAGQAMQCFNHIFGFAD